MSEEQNKKPEVQEIDLIELARKIWAKRRLVIKNCIIAAVVGVIIAFSIPKEYETKVTLAPESSGVSTGLGGNLGSLASLAGINLGNMSSEDAIFPELYPDVLKSTPFLVDLFNIKVKTKKGDLNTTLYDYLDKHQKSSWFGYLISAPFKALGWVVSFFKEKKESDPAKANYFDLTFDQAKMVKTLQKCIVASVHKKTGVLSFTVTMQDPLISAVLADTVRVKLQKYISDYRTQKSRNDLQFAEKLYKETQQDYFKAQKSYASYMDNNMDVVLQRYKSEEEHLKNEMNLAYNIYSQVAQQLQLAKAKVQEQTPVYTVIQPSVISAKAASPNKVLILFSFILLGCIFSLLWILYENKIKEYWRNR